MLDINYIRENKQKVQEACQNKNKKINIDELIDLDDKRRSLISESERIRSEQKKLGRDQINLARELKNKFKELSEELKIVEEKYKELLLKVPNVPFDDVPVGKDEEENKVRYQVGKPKKFDFKVKDHLELGEDLDIIDTKTAASISGARFNYLKGKGALLEFALINFVFSVLTDEKLIKKISGGYATKPFVPVVPPVMIKPDVYERMGRLTEEDKDDKYYLPKDDMYLIGSAEHTLGPIYMDKVIPEKDLPIRYIGFSTAFRREAGSYGKDTRGILRVHQFDKLEMETFCFSENSRDEQDFIVKIQEYLVSKLGIPYQLVDICTGDMGSPDARQIDIECWIPSQEKYRETHTSDLMTDYQARRLNTKVKRGDKTEYVHMNDATAFAIGRILIAIIENNQTKDGRVEVPKVLQKYTGFKTI